VASAYAELAAEYEAERPIYRDLASHVAERLSHELSGAGIPATVTSRVKETESFVAKALLRGYADPLREVGDKAGIRATVIYAEDVDKAEEVARSFLRVANREQKLDALAYNENGYLGVHLDAHYDDDAARQIDERFVGRSIEIQIRTMVQSAWAEVSHEQLYKPAGEVPDGLKRQIFRLVSLVELFDLEVERFLSEARQTPGFAEVQALVPLERELLRRFDVRRRGDRQLSLVMAASIVPLYELPPEEIYAERLQRWIDDNEQAIRVQFAEADALGGNPLIRQPEIFLIFERLTHDKRRLEERWPEAVPRAWLLELADHWGTPIEA
jgi:ppGpp synthetase/RelA/SpoT-type nucleotidyltranferase